MERADVLKQEVAEIKPSMRISLRFLIGIVAGAVGTLWWLQNYFIVDRNQRQPLGPDDSIDLINQKLASKNRRK